MDRAELNKVATDAINVHRREVAAMLQKAIWICSSGDAACVIKAHHQECIEVSHR
jgi:hypothetical protein